MLTQDIGGTVTICYEITKHVINFRRGTETRTSISRIVLFILLLSFLILLLPWGEKKLPKPLLELLRKLSYEEQEILLTL